MDDTNTYSHEDIQRYLQHKMSAPEMHAFEKAMMDDPFLADAIEGYRESNSMLAQKHLQQVERELRNDEEKTKVLAMPLQSTRWWKAAAAILLIATGTLSYLLWNNSNTKDVNNIAQLQSQEKSATNDTLSTASKGVSNVPPVAESTKQAAQSDKQLAANKPAIITNNNGSIEEDKNTIHESTNSAGLLAMKDENTNARNYNVTRREKEKSNLPAQGVAASKRSKELEESMVVGYGTQQTKLSSNAAVDNVPLSKRMDSSLAINQSLQGKLAGVQTNTIRLRGSSSRNGYMAQNEFKGKVTDPAGVPVAGALVYEKGKNSATVTDANGNFTLNLPDSTTEVNVAATGYSAALATISSVRPGNKIILKPGDNNLSEVVVTGYGSKRKKDITGSVSSINKDALPKAPRPLPNRLSPEPLSGWDAYDAYVKKAIRENKDSIGSNVYDREDVVLEFSIDKKGRPVGITIVRTGTRNDALKAITILKKGPKWISSTKDARMVYTFPFKQ